MVQKAKILRVHDGSQLELLEPRAVIISRMLQDTMLDYHYKLLIKLEITDMTVVQASCT